MSIRCLILSSFLFIGHLLFQLSVVEAQESRFRLGVIAPDTGPLAEYGLAIKNGIAMAFSDNPEISERFEVLYEDSKYQSKTSVSALHKLKAQGVQLVYNFGGPTSETLAPLADRHKIPLLLWTADSGLAERNDYVIRFINPPSDFGKTLNTHFKANNFTKLAVVKTENQYLNTLLEGLRANLSSEQELIVLDTFSYDERDFRVTVSKLKQLNVDTIGVFLFPGQVSQWYRQMREQRLALPSFGTDLFESVSELERAGEGVVGAVFANHGVTTRFRKRYVEQFGNDYQLPNAGLAYDLVTLIEQRLLLPGDMLSSEKIISQLKLPEEERGVSGNYRYRETERGDKYFEFPIELRVVTPEMRVETSS